jgi:tetratricopeptide (TPR) repeat protein
VFEVQDEIAAAISAALQLKLAPQPAAPERYKPNLPAYEAYLKGRHHQWKLTPESMGHAREYFEQAISLDPKFAQPYSELANHYISLAISGVSPASAVMPQAQLCAERALDIDPSLSEAHSCLGVKAIMFDYDRNEAERRFSLALARNPVPALTCINYVVYKMALGRPGDAEELMRRAVEADPLAAFNRINFASVLAVTGRDQEAERECRHILELDDRSYVGWLGLGRLQFARGDVNEALRCYERAYSLAPFYLPNVGALAGLLARTGDERRAEELLGKLGPPEDYGVPRAWAAYHLFKGETEKALDWWEKVIDQRDPIAASTPNFEPWRALRSSPRWPALAKRMNLPLEVI